MANMDLTKLDEDGRTLATYAVERQTSSCMKVSEGKQTFFILYNSH